MRPLSARLAILLLALALSHPAFARLVTVPETAALMLRAPIVCNGRVTELTNTLEKKMIAWPYPGFAPLAVEIWTAKIKVLSDVKGKVPDEIEVRFTQLDEHPADDKTTIISDGPIEISMKIGQRYRLFLKPAPGQPWYLGALDGDFDDGYAVQPLEDKESDDSPPFAKEEALQWATDYVRLLKPDAKISDWSIEARELEPSGWTVLFWWAPAHIHDFAPCAEIVVRGNRDIDPQSWVSDGTPCSVLDLKAGDVGHEYRIYFKLSIGDSFYNTSTLQGQLKQVAGDKVELADVHDSDWKPHQWPSLAIPIGDIRVLQKIMPLGPPWPVPTPWIPPR